MNTSKIIAIFVMGIVLISITCGVADTSENKAWIGDGIITKVSGSTLYILGQNNKVYQIDADNTMTIFDNGINRIEQVRVGDRVKIYGYIIGLESIRADNIRVFAEANLADRRSIKEVDNRSELKQTPVVSDTQLAPQLPLTNWEGKGIVTDINYLGRQIKMQTSSGNIAINAGRAIISAGGCAIKIDRLDLGDTIYIEGSVAGPYEVDAKVVRVLRTASEARNAVPVLPVSVVGKILQVDYPSRTFKMVSKVTALIVSVDDNTVIQSEHILKSFNDLKPGMRINMSGYGSLTTGYAAQHIQIISISP
jgi:hypothetical protein